MTLKPVIGICCNISVDKRWRRHAASEKYASAVLEVADGVPVLLPGLGPEVCVESVLASLDGVLLTGGASNIEPHHYGQEPAPGHDIRDPGRDHLALNIVRQAVEKEVPLFGICRGIQEINVALGGTLHQRLHTVPGRFDHRRPRDRAWDFQLAARQRIRFPADGYLARLTGKSDAIVNTLHGQGIDALAPPLAVEATAEDGTIEAVSVTDSGTFSVGVQWHAEHQTEDHELYRALFAAFGDAARVRAAERHGVATPVAKAS